MRSSVASRSFSALVRWLGQDASLQAHSLTITSSGRVSSCLQNNASRSRIANFWWPQQVQIWSAGGERFYCLEANGSGAKASRRNLILALDRSKVRSSLQLCDHIERITAELLPLAGGSSRQRRSLEPLLHWRDNSAHPSCFGVWCMYKAITMHIVSLHAGFFICCRVDDCKHVSQR
jgi:hypothetical protein